MYDHRHQKTRDPVRSPLDKLATARLVVGSVTTSESLVLYVFGVFGSIADFVPTSSYIPLFHLTMAQANQMT